MCEWEEVACHVSSSALSFHEQRVPVAAPVHKARTWNEGHTGRPGPGPPLGAEATWLMCRQTSG